MRGTVKFVSIAVSPREGGGDTLYAVDVIGQVWTAEVDDTATSPTWILLPRPPVPEGFANGTRRFREKRTGRERFVNEGRAS